MFIKIALISSIFLMANAANLPPFMKPCSQFSFDIDECVFSNLEEAKPYALEGIPELSIPNLKHVSFKNYRKHVETFYFAVWNFTVQGFNKYEVLEVNTDLKNNFFNIQILIPYVLGNGLYRHKNLDKEVLVDNTGSITSVAHNLFLDIDLKAKLVQRHNNTYFQLVERNIDISKCDKFRVNMTNAFFEKTDYSRELNKGLIEYSGFLFELFAPKLKETLDPLLVSFLDKLFKTYTYDELLY